MKLRLPVRLLAAVVAAVSHVTFLTIASASGAWAVGENDDLLTTDSSFVADGWSSSAQQNADATLSDKEAEALGQAEAGLPGELEAMGSLEVTTPLTEEKVAAVSAAPEVASVGGANTTQNVTSELLQSQENSLVAEYNAAVAGNTGMETPAVTLAAENTTATQTNTLNDTVSETTVASDANTTTQNLSAASAAPQTAALTTETVSGSTGAASVPSTASAAAPVFMTTGATGSSASSRTAPPVQLVGATTGAQDKGTLHLYILTGQSNSEGAVKTAPASQEQLARYKSDGIFWHTVLQDYSKASPIVVTSDSWGAVEPHTPYEGGNLCMGPEYGFSYMMNKLANDASVLKDGERLNVGQLAIIKASLNGGGNQYWKKGSTTYNLMLQGIENAITQAAQDGYTSISIDGLLYLQGESNGSGSLDVKEGYESYLSNLTSDLNTWKATQTSAAIQNMAVSFQNNSVLGEPSQGSATSSQIAMATNTDGHVNTDSNGKGFVYAVSDLGKGPDNLHYSGEAQITIGARYAYAFAVQEGYNVGAVRGSNSSVSLDNAMAWWMETRPETTDVVKWDVSSVSTRNTISNTLTVGGILIEDPYKGQVNISGGTLRVGEHGFTLQEGDLSISSVVETEARQEWNLTSGRTLILSNASNTISGDVAVTGPERGVATIHAAGTSQNWTVSGNVDLKVGSAESLTVTEGANVGFGACSGSAMSLDSLTLGNDASLTLGGTGAVVSLTVGSLDLGSGTSISLDFLSTSLYDSITISDSLSTSGTVTFNFNVLNTGRGGSYDIVTGWGDNTNFTVTGLDSFGVAASFANVDGTLVLTLPGGADYTKAWPEGTPETATITTTNVYDASAGGTKSNVLVNQRTTTTGDLYFFTVGNASGTVSIGTESKPVDLYAELSGVPATWVCAAGSNGYATKITDLWGNASLKVTGENSFSTTAYAAVNAQTVHGNVYMELDNPNATYASINGTYQASITGNNTIVISGGSVSGKVVAGSVNGATTISGSTYLQIDDGTFNGEVTGGNNLENSTIKGNVNVSISGGTFKNWVLIGGMYGGKVEGDVYLTISGGDFSALNTTKGIYAGVGSSKASVLGNSYITLQDIGGNNAFASYTGILSGNNQADSAPAISNRQLELSGVTTAINANLQSFTTLKVTHGSDATLSGTKQATLGGVGSVSISGNSTLSLYNDKGGQWDLSSISFDLEKGSTLKKTNDRWTNIGTLTGYGTYDVAGASGYGSQVGSLADFKGTIHVAAGNSLQMTSNAGSAGTTFSVDKGGTAALYASSEAMGTLTGDGEVVFRSSTLTVGNTHSYFNFDNWKGIVKIVDADVNAGSMLNLSKLGCDGSTIQLEGVGASKNVYLAYDNSNVVTADMSLSGAGLKISGGYSNKTTYFEGDWSGDGGFTFAYQDCTQKFNFLGNMTAYTGTISLGGEQTLQFGSTNGKQESVNMGIEGASDTGKGTIEGTGGKTAKVEIYYMTNAVSRSTMTGNLSLTQKGDQTLTLYGQNSYTGETRVEKGCLRLEDSGTTGTGNVVLVHDTELEIHNIQLGDNAVITTKDADATISNHSVVNANSIMGTAENMATISHANIAVAAGKSLELGYVTLDNVALSGNVNLTSAISADSLTVSSDTTLKLASEQALNVTGALTLQTGATLDLAKLFAAPQAAPQLLSLDDGAPAGRMSLLSSGNDGIALTSGAGDEPQTYVLATAGSIDLQTGVNLTNVLDGYKGTLSTKAADSGSQLVLTLTSAGATDLVWKGGTTGIWNTVATNKDWYQKDVTPQTEAAFSENANVWFNSGTSTATLGEAITAGTMTLESGANLTVNTAGYNLTSANLVATGGASLTKSGAGTATFGGSDAAGVTLIALSVTGGSVEFDELVTVTGGNRIEPSGSSSITFRKGLSYTGSNDYALVVGNSITVTLGDTSTMSEKAIGVAQDGTLRLLDNATVTVARVHNSGTAGNNGTLVLLGDSELNIVGGIGDSTITKVIGTGAINYTGDINRTLKLTGDISEYSGTLDNQSSAVLTLALSDAVTIASMNITHSGVGKVDVALNKDSVTLNGTQLVNNVTQNTSWSAFIGGAGLVTATGKVVTGRLVVGDTQNDASAVFTLSGSSAMLNKGSDAHVYDGAVQGYGTFQLENGATQELTNISGYNGKFNVDATSSLTVTTNNLPGTLTVEGEGALHMRTNQGGQNTNLKTVSASNLHLDRDDNHNSRFVYNASSNISGVDHLYFDGAQMWLSGKDMIDGNAFTGDVTFNATTYSENNVFGGAAMRIANDATFSGAVDVNANTKLAWGADKTIEFGGVVTGEGNLELASFQNSDGTFKVSGNASGYQGALTSDSHITLNVASGAQLSLTGGSNVAGAVTLDGSLTMNGDTDSTISGAISGNGTLTQAGAGKLTLDNATVGNALINVTAGTLELGSAVTSVSGGLTLAEGATLKLTQKGNDAVVFNTNALTLSSGSILDLGALGIAGTEQSITLATGSVSMADSAAWSSVQLANFAAQDNYTLGYANNALVLTFNGTIDNLIWDNSSSDGQWNTASGNWHVAGADDGSSTFRDGVDVSFVSGYTNTPALQADATVHNMTIEDGQAVTMGGSSKLTVSNIASAGGSLNLGSNSAEITGTATLGALNGSAGLKLAAGSSLTVGGVGDSTYSGTISGSGSLTKTGDGTLTLGGNNYTGDYTGAIVIDSGTLKVGDNNALGKAASITVNPNGTLDVNGKGDGNTQCYNITLAGGTLTNSVNGPSHGSKQLLKGITLTANSTVSGTGQYGLIAGGYGATTLNLGEYTLEKTGTGTFFMTNTTAIGTGTLKISQGAVDFNQSKSDSGDFRVNIEMAGGRVTSYLNLGGDITVTTTSATPSAFGAQINNKGHIVTFDGAQDLTVTGKVTGNGGLVKAGTGTLTLSNANNDYTGTTTVNGGILKVDTAKGLGNSSATTVNGGTLLVNHATGLGAGAVTVNEGGTLGFADIATTTGNLTVNDGATLAFGGEAKLTTGTLTLGSGAVLDISRLGLSSESGKVILAMTDGIFGASSVAITAEDLATLSGNVVGVHGFTYTLGTDAKNHLVLTYEDSRKTLIWDNAQENSLWTANGEQDANANWHQANSPSSHLTFNDYDRVEFRGTTAVTLGSDVTAGRVAITAKRIVTIKAEGNDLIVDGDVNGTGASLNISGNDESKVAVTGTTTLQNLAVTGAEISLGGTTKISSNLLVQGGGKFTADGNVAASAVTVGGNSSAAFEGALRTARLDVTDSQIGIGGIASVATLTMSNSRLENNGLLDVYKSDSVLNGNNTITGSGTMIVRGMQLKNGTTTITGGQTLSLKDATGIPGNVPSITGTTGQEIIKLGDATLSAVTDSWNIDKSVDSVVLMDSANGTTVHAVGHTLGIAANISGTGRLVKTGTGTLELSGTNEYSGGTDVQAGTLLVSSANALPGSTTVASGARLVLSSSLKEAAQLDSLTINGGTLSLAGIDMLDISGTLTLADSSRLDLTNLVFDSTETKYTLASGGTINLDPEAVALTFQRGVHAVEGTNPFISVIGAPGSQSLVLNIQLDTPNGMVWDGGTSNWNTTNDHWHADGAETAGGTRFLKYDDVVFDGTNLAGGAAAKGDNPVLTENVYVTNMTITKDNTVTVNTNNYRLDVDFLEAADGSAFVKEGSGTASIGIKDASFGADMSVARNGGTLDLLFIDVDKHAGGMTVSGDLDGRNGTLNVTIGTLETPTNVLFDKNSSMLNVTKIVVNEQSSAVVNGALSATHNITIQVKDGGSLEIGGGANLSGNRWLMEGEGTIHVTGHLDLAEDVNNYEKIDGSLTVRFEEVKQTSSLLTLRQQKDAVVSIGVLQFTDSTQDCFYTAFQQSDSNRPELHIDELQVADKGGNGHGIGSLCSYFGELQGYQQQGSFYISQLTGEGRVSFFNYAYDALGDAGRVGYESPEVFYLGGESKANNLFSGTIQLYDGGYGVSENSKDKPKHTVLVLEDEIVASQSVITINNPDNGNHSKYQQNYGKYSNFGIGIDADNVKVQAITDTVVQAGNTVKVFSGTVGEDVHATYESDDNVRTLQLTGKAGDTAETAYVSSAGFDKNVNIVKSGAGKQTFKGDSSNFNADINVQRGVLEFLNNTSLHIEDLTLAGNEKGSTANNLAIRGDVVGTADVFGTAKVYDGSAINANMTMEGGSVLDVSNAVTKVERKHPGVDSRTHDDYTGGLDLMGNNLTLHSGISLSDTDIYNLFKMGWGDTYALAYDVGSFTLGGETYTEKALGWSFTGEGNEVTGTEASKYLANLQLNDYFICYSGDLTPEGGTIDAHVVYIVKVPEPATTTLSLLALAALCARRRRK